MHTRIFTADLLLVVGTSLWVSTHLDEIDEMDDQTEQEMTFAFYSAFVAFIGLIVLTNGLEFKPPLRESSRSSVGGRDGPRTF